MSGTADAYRSTLDEFVRDYGSQMGLKSFVCCS